MATDIIFIAILNVRTEKDLVKMQTVFHDRFML